MNIKKIAASILTVTTLALMGISTQTQTVNAAVASADTSSVIYITNNNGAPLYSLSNDTMSTTSRSLANKSAWITNKVANVNGVTYYQVATNTWVSAHDLSTEEPVTALDKTMYVQANGDVNIYDAPNGNYVSSISGGSSLHVYASKTDSNNTTWYDVGQSHWINGTYLSNDNVKETLTMSATAYDPVVLGSNMGYSGVAANLSKFPKGTHLRITDGSGNTYDRVVNDTGLFAYSNPNQLDIAMPNSQALQFGRQNVTVQVLG